MDFNGLNWCFFSPHQSILWDFSFTMCLREIRGICVRRGGRWGEDVGDLVMWGIVINFVIVIKAHNEKHIWI